MKIPTIKKKIYTDLILILISNFELIPFEVVSGSNHRPNIRKKKCYYHSLSWRITSSVEIFVLFINLKDNINIVI